MWSLQLFDQMQKIITSMFSRSKFLAPESLADEKLTVDALEPAVDPLELRVERTIACRDTDYIPKVDRAGEIELNHNPPYQIMHNGVKVELGGYHGDWMQRIITSLRGHHEPQEEKVFYEILKHVGDKPTMLELGAYWAYYSLWFRRTFPDATSFMVEPILNNFELAKRNFKLNGLEGHFIYGCIGDSYLDNTTFVNWNKDRIDMPQFSVDHIIEANNIEFLDVLHSDIQGAEVDMLNGCLKSIENNKIGFFVVSTHGDKHEKCLNFFREREMHIIAEHSIDASASADGLIVAQSKAVPLVACVDIS